MISALAGFLMPTVAGTILILALIGRPWSFRELGLAAAMGYLAGAGLTSLGLWLFLETGPDSAHRWTAVLLFAVTVLSALIAGFRGPRAVAPEDRFAGAGRASAERLFWFVLVVLIGVHGWFIVGEALVRPTYPWDAWSAWSVKAKVWATLGPQVDFVSFSEWLSQPGTAVYTNEAWSYPELIPLFQYWITRWTGGWHENLVLLPWPLVWIALLASFYLGLRSAGSSALLSVAATFIVSALPILAVQAALPGYADIWMAAGLLCFSIAAVHWLSTRSIGWLCAAIGFCVMVAAAKLEGLIWAVLALPVLFLPLIGRRWRWGLAAGLAVIFVGWLATGGIEITLAGEPLVIRPDLVVLPYLGRYPLAFSNQFGSFGRAFFLLPNWHLVWYLLLPASAAAAIGLPARLRIGWIYLLLAGLAFLFALFFFTQASVWAERMTASNRLALHIVPAWLFWIAVGVDRLLDRGRGSDQAPASA